MKARIASFRRSIKRQHTKQIIIKVDGISDKEKARSLIGKTVVWKSSAGKEIKGKISNLHGNGGSLRVVLERGVPGQAIGEEVEVN